MYRKQYLANKSFAMVHSTCTLVHAVGSSVVIKSGPCSPIAPSRLSLSAITGILLLLFFLKLIASGGVLLLHWFGVVFFGGELVRQMQLQFQVQFFESIISFDFCPFSFRVGFLEPT
jgi:hypothetical protein